MGLMTELARRHDLTAVMLVDDEFDVEECRRAMQAYCREVVLVQTPTVATASPSGCCSSGPWSPPGASSGCGSRCQRCSRRWIAILRARRFDVVNLEFPYLGHCDLRQAPPGEKLPALVVDSHEIAYDLARQFAARRRQPGPSPLCRRQLAQAAARGTRHLPSAPMASTFAARRTSSACSTRSPASARRSSPTRRTSITTNRVPRTRRPTAAPWSISGCSRRSPISMA